MLSLKAEQLSLPAPLGEAFRKSWLLQTQAFDLNTQHYPEPSGDPVLVERLQALTAHWEGPLLVTNSATEALYLSLLTLGGLPRTAPRLAVRLPCFFAVLRQARQLGWEILPWEQVRELRALSFDALFLTSNFAPPAGRSLTGPERIELEALAASKGAWLIEDNPYDPLWFEGPPCALEAEKIIRIGSLSKILSPRFRLGFLRASQEIFKALRSSKITLNLSTAADLQQVAARALEPALLALLRKEWHTRAQTLRRALREKGLESVEPQGGSFISVPVKNSPQVLQRALTEGLELDANEHYYPDGLPRPYVRLHFGALKGEELPEAARRLQRACAL